MPRKEKKKGTPLPPSSWFLDYGLLIFGLKMEVEHKHYPANHHRQCRSYFKSGEPNIVKISQPERTRSKQPYLLSSITMNSSSRETIHRKPMLQRISSLLRLHEHKGKRVLKNRVKQSINKLRSLKQDDYKEKHKVKIMG